MLHYRNLFLSLIILILAYSFWVSPNFKEIAAGVAIFLFGMLSLEQGFQSFSGGLLEKILKTSTDRLYKSIAFGAVTTSIMQSSSLVSILTISFLSAGLITLTQGIGIVFGANLGTTTGAWLIAGFGLKVDIASYAMPMLAFGMLFIFQRNVMIKSFGYILAGLGFLFLGIHYMKDGFEAFKSTIDLASYSIDGIRGLLLFSAIGILSTVIMQSSHATLVLIITALAAHQINYESAIALAIGGNVGTTITAILGSLSSNINGKRLAGAHLIFNLLTGIVAILFIYQIELLVDFIAVEVGIRADDYTLKLAIFHSLFNLLGVIMLVPFVGKLVLFLESFLKEKVEEDKLKPDTVKYLNNSVLEFPEASLEAIRNESKHLYNNAFEIIAHGLNLKRGYIVSDMDLDEVLKHNYSKRYVNIEELYHQKIKDIYGEIIDFATRAQSNVSPEHVEELYKLKLANRSIVEAIKDAKHLQKNLIKFVANPNNYIREEYNSIKKSLAELLRTLNTIATTQEEDVIVLLLSKAKVHAQKYDIVANGTLDNLIRNKLISNQMATSLMNDSTYAFNISTNLISMAEVLFVEQESDIKNLHEDGVISDSEVDSILEKKE